MPPIAVKLEKIGARGFEPPAFRTRNGRATKLRYAPMNEYISMAAPPPGCQGGRA